MAGVAEDDADVIEHGWILCWWPVLAAQAGK
jgi:hypothetical protein